MSKGGFEECYCGNHVFNEVGFLHISSYFAIIFLFENGSGVTGKDISANVNDKRKKCSDDNAFSKRDAEKKRKVMGPSIGPSDGPSIGPPPSAPTKVHLKTHSIGPKQRPSIGPSIGPTMPAKDISGPFMPASAESIAGEKLDEK